MYYKLINPTFSHLNDTQSTDQAQPEADPPKVLTEILREFPSSEHKRVCQEIYETLYAWGHRIYKP